MDSMVVNSMFFMLLILLVFSLSQLLAKLSSNPTQTQQQLRLDCRRPAMNSVAYFGDAVARRYSYSLSHKDVHEALENNPLLRKPWRLQKEHLKQVPTAVQSARLIAMVRDDVLLAQAMHVAQRVAEYKPAIELAARKKQQLEDEAMAM
jgi:hypothetical protein